MILNLINEDHMADIFSFNFGMSIYTVSLSLLFLLPITNFKFLFTLD